MKALPLILTSLALPLLLGGCDQLSNKLGLEDPAKKEARLDAEGKAVGGGCRHSGRAIEDCYAIYTWLPKESVFTGWREMDEYMRSNNLETVAPQLPPPPPPDTGKKKKKAPAPLPEEAAGADKAEEAAPPAAPQPTDKH
ncbi:hypothetical protein [Azovibrio restrictus]|uniref:hypothetical protein n=1 Tax=Azovibrio restrictus TaxID=146938 RepID=UPI0026F0D3D9|nr:hypothetical protein [Azovibrio restrictus]MDD3484853.1 hypothetical protein [Azovibrio restrictus]